MNDLYGPSACATGAELRYSPGPQWKRKVQGRLSFLGSRRRSQPGWFQEVSRSMSFLLRTGTNCVSLGHGVLMGVLVAKPPRRPAAIASSRRLAPHVTLKLAPMATRRSLTRRTGCDNTGIMTTVSGRTKVDITFAETAIYNFRGVHLRMPHFARPSKPSNARLTQRCAEDVIGCSESPTTMLEAV